MASDPVSCRTPLAVDHYINGNLHNLSIDGADFEPFLLNTTETTALFDGQAGHTYRFFSVATDNVGQREASVETAQATTTIVGNSGPVMTGPATATENMRPTFTWTSVGNAVSYDLWIANRSSGANPALRVDSNATSFQVQADLGIGLFRAWVRART